MGPRARLEVLARRAGYGPGALERLARACHPWFVPGTTLDDAAVKQVCDAVGVCAMSGMTDEHVHLIVDEYRERFGDEWRDPFWRIRMMIANRRYREPERYGPSPCDLPEPPSDDDSEPAPQPKLEPVPQLGGAIAAARQAVADAAPAEPAPLELGPPAPAAEVGPDALAPFDESPSSFAPDDPATDVAAAAPAPTLADPGHPGPALDIHPAVAAAPVLSRLA